MALHDESRYGEHPEIVRNMKPRGTDHGLTMMPISIADASDTWPVPVPMRTCNAQYQGLMVMIWPPMLQMGSMMINLHNTSASSNVSATCQYSNANKTAR